MKTPHSHTIVSRAQAGSTLLVALVLSLVLMVTLGTLLTVINSEYRLIHRAHYYGNAIYLAEAGVEEAVAMINHGNGNWGANGWFSLGGSSYTKTVTNFSANNGTVIGRYVVNVYDASSASPSILCTGQVDATSTTANGIPSPFLSRVVKVGMARRGTFQWGLLAQNQIDLNGNNIEIDSFDSSDPSYSNYNYGRGFGVYQASKRRDNGDVASNAGIVDAISIGNANVYGHAMTGPGGTVTVGPNGFVAALGGATNGVIDPNRVSHSMNVDLPPPTLPSPWNPVNGASPYNINGNWTFSGGASSPVDFVISAINLKSSEKLRIQSGYMRFYVTGNISVAGNATIQVDEGARIELYVLGSTDIAGNGVVNNDQRATSFQLYGLSSNPVKVSGNGQLTALVYAPLSAVSFKGGGSSGTVVGAIVGNTITLDGHVDFHYDEALKDFGPTRGYSIAYWQEL